MRVTRIPEREFHHPQHHPRPAIEGEHRPWIAHRQRTTATEPTPDQEALFRKLKSWFLADFEKQAEWREAAREDFAFTSGDQLSETDKQKLRDMNRPIIIMNRVEPIVDSVSGSEVANRQEVQLHPAPAGRRHRSTRC